MWPSSSSQIQTFVQAGGIASVRMRSSVASSLSGFPAASRYENPRPRRILVMPSPPGSLRRVLARLARVLLLVAQALFVLSRVPVRAGVLAGGRLGIGFAGRRFGAALVVRGFLAEVVGLRRLVARRVVHAGLLPCGGAGKP